ncbi:HU family DNA-binding protein [Spirochaeta lutea]|uniref:Integration host factor n=1 Tax=Spirochaeta lutea TaxID=1480694 RepID=A0A098R4E0_9SPIO|nr:HU family DNA-binding protein [Spirochaeta lutea]KGE73632.1 integration host factor [Spirochaeta lutea]
MHGGKLTKAEIVESISETSGLTKKQIHSIIDLFLQQLKDSLGQDKIIEFRGFGTFEVKTRKGRDRARNPKTGQTVSVENHGVVNFRPGKDLKDAVWSLRD